jgi:hypothetical protein
VSESNRPPAFDPRRLADLASRLAPAAPPQRSIPAPSPPAPSPPDPSRPHPGVAARADEVGSVVGTGESAGSVVGTGESAGSAGHPQIDAVLAELERVERLPPDQHIPVYESVHRTLQETLRSIEQN